VWVVTVHTCDGSMAEAIDVHASFGGFRTEQDAREFANILYECLSKKDRYTEWFTQHFEVPEIQKIKLPRVTDAALLKELGVDDKVNEGKVALDVEEIARKVIEGEEFEALPPPVKQEEVDQALESIFGKCDCDIDYLDPKCRNPKHINPPEGFE